MFANYDEYIGVLSSQLNRKLIRYLSSHLEKYDITLEQWVVLKRLSEQHEINQKQLSERVDKDQATLARILDILERKKLVIRQVDKQDRRAFIIFITNKGSELKKQISPIIEAAFEKILHNISEEKIAIFKEVLLKMNENIDEENCRYREYLF